MLLRAIRRRLNGQEREVFDALGDPPDLTNLGPEFWSTQEGKLLADLRPQIERMALAAVAARGATVPIVWDEAVIAREAADWAARYAFELVRGINANTERLLRDQVARFIQTPGMTIGQLRAALVPAFGDVRAQMIAVTETTRAFAQGEGIVQDYLRRAGLEMKRHWNTSMDERVCPICAPLDGKPEGEWGAYSSGPPGHVQCRCWLTIRAAND